MDRCIRAKAEQTAGQASGISSARWIGALGPKPNALGKRSGLRGEVDFYPQRARKGLPKSGRVGNLLVSWETKREATAEIRGSTGVSGWAAWVPLLFD